MLFPVLVKHPRCRPFFQVGLYGVVAARVHSTQSIRFYDRDDVEGLGLDAMRVHLRARENLRALLVSGEIEVRAMFGPTGNGFLAIDHPLASSCLLTTTLREKARGMFGFQRVIVAIVRRNVLVVFADPGARRREEMAHTLARSHFERAARCRCPPLARRFSKRDGNDEIDLFWLDDNSESAGPRPIQSSFLPHEKEEPTPPARPAFTRREPCEPCEPMYLQGSTRTLVLPPPSSRQPSLT